MTINHRYTDEQVEWLRQAYPVTSQADLDAAFNARFGIQVSKQSVLSAIKRYRLKSGRTGHFTPGSVSWNKGKTGYIGANRTSFKKGNLPHNHKPLWSERMGKDGYVEMSVPERNPYTGFPSRYKHKHVWLWEQANGKKPKGTAVVFKDGDIRNFDIDNLMLVSRKELLVMNLHDYKNQPAALKPSILALAKMEAKAGIRSRSGRAIEKERKA